MKNVLAGLILAAAAVANAQSPQLTVVQAANQPQPTASVAAVTAVTTAVSADGADVLKLLQEMKAANDETLKKQQATLEKLDELQKAAEQIKIYAHRG